MGIKQPEWHGDGWVSISKTLSTHIRNGKSHMNMNMRYRCLIQIEATSTKVYDRVEEVVVAQVFFFLQTRVRSDGDDNDNGAGRDEYR